MRTTFGVVGILSLTSAVAAQSACESLTTLFPDCARPCVSTAAGQVGCDATDLACRCEPTNSDAISASAIECVGAACTNIADLIAVQGAGAQVCGCVATAAPDPTDPEPTPPSTPTDDPDDETTTSEEDDETTTTEDPVTTEPPTTTDPSDPEETCDSESPCQESADAVPECASSCINSAAVTNAKCATDDYECQCSSSAVIQNAAIGCVTSGCGIETGLQVLSSVGALCECVTSSPTVPCEATATATATPTSPGDDDDDDDDDDEHDDDDDGDDDGEPTTTCEAATTSDCKPVASTAIPKCAQECFISAGPQVGCDDPNDYACRCGEEARSSLTGIIVPCVATACDAAALPSIIAGSEEVCSCALAPPSGGDCDTTTTRGGGGGGGGGGSSKPTKTKTNKPTEPTSCEATTTDCGPVATSAIPECAQECFSRAAPSIGCDVDEFNCYCQEDARAQLTGLLVPCVATACDSNLLPSIIAGAEEVCACATAPAGDGDCDGGNGGGNYPPKPTEGPGGGSGGGEGGSGGSSCKPAETSDCAPLTTLVPDCARPCFASAGPEVGCDDPEDLACRCKPDTQASLSQILVPCVASRCDAAQLPSVIAGASSVCACATAAPVAGDGDCPGEGGNGGGAPEPPAPTGGSGGGSGGSEGSSCVPGEVTSADCLPVASSVVPECAQACFSSAAPDVGCEVNSFGCLCQEEAQASLSAILVPCVASRCAASQLTDVIAGASSVCECALAAPTAGPDTCEGGSGGDSGSGGDHGGDAGGEEGESGGDAGGNEGGEGGSNEGGDSGAPPQETGPETIVPGSGARMEISIVAAVFGSFWLLAVML